MSSADRHPVAVRVAVMLAATAGLYVSSVAVLQLPCWAFFFLIAAISFPIWRYQREYTLFERRAMLVGLTREESHIRRWLWKGQISSVSQVFVAVFWATLLLAFASLLGPWHWLVLVADAVFLALLVQPVTNWLAREIHVAQSGIAARRWPLAWINLAILTIAFFTADFYVVGAQDTREFEWLALAEKTFLEIQVKASCAVAGVLVGGLATFDVLAWNAAEHLIPSLPSRGLKWLAWTLFLLQAGLIAFALTRLHLGVVALLDRQGKDSKAQEESPRAFTATILVLVVLCFLAAFATRGFDLSSLSMRARQIIVWANPCRTDSSSLTALKARLDARLQEIRVQEQARASNLTNARLDALFAQAEGGVDVYLNWYFSILGEYQRLGAAITGRFGGWMQEMLEQKVYGETFKAGLEQASREIVSASRDRVANAARELGAQLKGGVQSNPCLLGNVDLRALDGVERDAVRASTAAFGGATVAVAAGLLARRAATKAAMKPVFQGAASLGGRTVTKRAGSILVVAAGGAALCGPLAPLCALAAGAVAWITLDKAFIEIDELRFRDDMRKELLESLRSQKAELAKELNDVHDAAVDRAVSGIQQSVQRVFVPAREGV